MSVEPHTLLTRGREAVWQAIDTSPLLVDAGTSTGRAFNRTMRFDETSLDRDASPSGIGDFPCLSVAPTTIDPAWFTHEMMDFHLILALIVWTDDWLLKQPEEIAVNLWRSIHKQGPDGLESSVSYVKATGYHPKLIRPIEFAFVKLGETQAVKATRLTLRVGLRLQQDPFA